MPGKLVLTQALMALLLHVLFVGVAQAGVEGPDEYGGHGYHHCEAPTHASWYDPRNEGHTVYDREYPNGDSTFYVDDEPMTGFDPDGDYRTMYWHDCQGDPVLHTTAFGAVTYIGGEPQDDKHIGFPRCPRSWGDDRNPYCDGEKTGVQGGFYVADGDKSHEAGWTFGVTVP
jgi:hypothetical protein